MIAYPAQKTQPVAKMTAHDAQSLIQMIHPSLARPGRSGWKADDGRMWLDILQDHGVCPYLRAFTDRDIAQAFGAGADHHAVFQRRMPLLMLCSSSAKRYAMIDLAVITDLRGLSDDHAHAMIDQQSSADLRAGMDLDTGHMPRKLRKRTREEKVLVLIEPVCLAVVKQSMEALIEEDDLERGARRRVAVADRASVVEQALEDHNTDIHSLEIKRTSRCAENTM